MPFEQPEAYTAHVLAFLKGTDDFALVRNPATEGEQDPLLAAMLASPAESSSS